MRTRAAARNVTLLLGAAGLRRERIRLSRCARNTRPEMHELDKIQNWARMHVSRYARPKWTKVLKQNACIDQTQKTAHACKQMAEPGGTWRWPLSLPSCLRHRECSAAPLLARSLFSSDRLCFENKPRSLDWVSLRSGPLHVRPEPT